MLGGTWLWTLSQDWWWASSSDMLIYPSIFTFPLLPLHCQYTTTHSDHTQSWSHSLHWTDLAYLMDTWFTIHMFLLLFLVSPTCALPGFDQSWALAPRGQALTIGLLWMSLMLSLLLPFVFNLPVFTFCSTQAPTNCLYEFPPELRFSTYASHCLALILHHFASHCTASQSHCLYSTPHLEAISCPQNTPSEPHRIYT